VLAAEDTDFIYRVYTSGFRMLYCPDLCVYHNHGRRLDVQVSDLLKGYAIGRGAFYCKHIITGDSTLLKMAYWELSAISNSLIRGSNSGKSRQDTLKYVWNMFVGACRYLPSFCRAGSAFSTAARADVSLHNPRPEQYTTGQQPLLGRVQLKYPESR
jgi:hypothetical protein